MSASEAAPSDDDQPGDAPEIDSAVEPAVDWLLRHFVFLANRGMIELGITLHVSGFLVSGTLTSARNYVGLLAELIKGTGLDVLVPTLESIRDTIYIERDSRDEASPEELAPALIHLRDARYFHTAGTPIPGNQSVLWRGRLSEVSGFTIGSLSAESTPA